MPWWLRMLVGWVLLAVAFYVTTLFVPGIHVNNGLGGYLVVALVFGLINAVLGRVVRILALPLTIVTFGFFLLVINGFMLWIAEHLTRSLVIDHFWWDAIAGALVLGIVSWILNLLLHRAEKLLGA
jgi:putative membrane protein